MNNIILGIWVFIGLIGWIFTLQSHRKQWLIKGNDSDGLTIVIGVLCICFPFWLIGGLFALIYWSIVIDKKYWTLYFNRKRYERKQLLKKFRNE